VTELILRAHRAMLPEGERPADVAVRDGVVVAVERVGALSGDVRQLSTDEVLLPGLVDTHVHVNEPGRTEWEGFDSATRAAAAGGVTTIVDMPLNSVPPTVDVASLRVKQDCARAQVHVDVGFWGGAVPGGLTQLRPLHDAGVLGFKCFLLDSGVPEFAPLSTAELAAVLTELASFDGLLVVHAEYPDTVAAQPDPHGRVYADFLASRPGTAEDVAVARLIVLARRTGARVHVLHLSSTGALPMIADARADGVRISAETCPHYLTFAAADVPDGATQFKCCPPIRAATNREVLWTALQNNVIGLVVSDHSPCTPELKELATGDFGRAWGGVASLQLGLSAVWTGAHARGLGLSDVVGWMSQAPSDLVGLHRKGRIAVGADADLVVFAPDEEFTVDAARLEHRNPVTPYDGRRLRGVVRETWLRGARIDRVNARGRLLRR